MKRTKQRIDNMEIKLTPAGPRDNAEPHLVLRKGLQGANVNICIRFDDDSGPIISVNKADLIRALQAL